MREHSISVVVNTGYISRRKVYTLNMRNPDRHETSGGKVAKTYREIIREAANDNE